MKSAILTAIVLTTSNAAVPAYSMTDGRTRFHPKDRDNGYVLTMDGFSISIAGDTEDISEMGKLHDIGVVFLPCNLSVTKGTWPFETSVV